MWLTVNPMQASAAEVKGLRFAPWIRATHCAPLVHVQDLSSPVTALLLPIQVSAASAQQHAANDVAM